MLDSSRSVEVRSLFSTLVAIRVLGYINLGFVQATVITSAVLECKVRGANVFPVWPHGKSYDFDVRDRANLWVSC